MEVDKERRGVKLSKKKIPKPIPMNSSVVANHCKPQKIHRKDIPSILLSDDEHEFSGTNDEAFTGESHVEITVMDRPQEKNRKRTHDNASRPTQSRAAAASGNNDEDYTFESQVERTVMTRPQKKSQKRTHDTATRPAQNRDAASGNNDVDFTFESQVERTVMNRNQKKSRKQPQTNVTKPAQSRAAAASGNNDEDFTIESHLETTVTNRPQEKSRKRTHDNATRPSQSRADASENNDEDFTFESYVETTVVSRPQEKSRKQPQTNATRPVQNRAVVPEIYDEDNTFELAERSVMDRPQEKSRKQKQLHVAGSLQNQDNVSNLNFTCSNGLNVGKKGRNYCPCSACAIDNYFTSNSTRFIKAPKYQIIKRRYRNKFFEHLIVFDVNDANQCFDMTWRRSENRYFCCACERQNTYVYAEKLYDDINGEYIRMGRGIHVCKPKPFIPEDPTISAMELTTQTSIYKLPNYKIVYKKLFGPKSKKLQHLLVFDPDDHDLCYEFQLMKYSHRRGRFECVKCYAKDRSQVEARIVKNKDGEMVVEVTGIPHSCLLKKYNPIEYIWSDDEGDNDTVPIYELVERQKGDEYVENLVVFVDDENSSYYEYTWKENTKGKPGKFVCPTCEKKGINVWVKILPNSLLEFGNYPHVCEPREHYPEDSDDFDYECINP